MHLAIEKLKVVPEHIIVDGNKFKPYKEIPHTTIVKGDAKFMSIAAASVLAKTYRDAYMEKIAIEFPEYQWQKNKGYPTLQHRDAIRNFGVTKYHRKSFRLLPEQLKLDL
jgi:ribonuclease HII